MQKIINTLQILSLAIFLSFVYGCSSSAPGEVAEKFLTTVAKKDFAGAKQYTTKETGALLDMMAGLSAQMGAKMKAKKDFKFIMEGEEINGDDAVVSYREKDGGNIKKIKLKKVKGDWKIHEKKR